MWLAVSELWERFNGRSSGRRGSDSEIGFEQALQAMVWQFMGGFGPYIIGWK